MKDKDINERIEFLDEQLEWLKKLQRQNNIIRIVLLIVLGISFLVIVLNLINIFYYE